jgi:hypothetical protein
MRALGRPLLLAAGALSALCLLAPASATAETIEATVLCAEETTESNACEGESYGAGSPLTASSSEAVMQVLIFGIPFSVKCTASEFEGESTEDFDESPLHETAESGMTFGGCKTSLGNSCEVSAVNLPYGGEFLREDGSPGDGRFFLFDGSAEVAAGISVACAGSPPISCTYEVNETSPEVDSGATRLASLAIEGGAEPTATASAVAMKAASGTCPGSSPTFSATYRIEAPAPMFVGKRPVVVDLSPASVTMKKGATEKITIENGGDVGWKIEDAGFVGLFGLKDPNSCIGKSLTNKGEKCVIELMCKEAGDGAFLLKWAALNAQKDPSGDRVIDATCKP